MTGDIRIKYINYHGYDEYSSFNVKGGEKLYISNLSKKSYKKDTDGNITKERLYKDNTLYSGETRVSWDGLNAFYSYNGSSSNYVLNVDNYYNEYANHYWPGIYNNDPERFYEEYYSDSGIRFTNQDKVYEDANYYNPEALEVNKQQHDLLLEVVNADKKDGDNTLSKKDLDTMYSNIKKNKNAYKNIGVTDIIFDGNKGIYRLFYTDTETKETKSLTFDYVVQGETQTIEDYEQISNILNDYEIEQRENFAERVRNFKDPNADYGTDWVTPLINFFKKVFS